MTDSMVRRNDGTLRAHSVRLPRQPSAIVVGET